MIKFLKTILSHKNHNKTFFEKDFIENFKYFSDDTIIVSYPKSGSTWLRFILSNIINFKVKKYKEIDFLCSQKLVPAISTDGIFKTKINLNKMIRPRILRSHSLHTEQFPKVIYLLRDGRDVMVSYYYHFKKFNNYKGSLLEFMSNNYSGIDWHEHVNSWLYNQSNTSELLLIKYEDLLNDTKRGIIKMLKFIGMECSDEEVDKAIKLSSFEKMQLSENKSGLGIVASGNREINFIRKGKKGVWQDELGKTEIKVIKELLGNTLIKSGYEKSENW